MNPAAKASVKAKKRSDGGRNRCLSCGHPRVEHRTLEGCTVPRCDCNHHEGMVEPTAGGV